MKPKFYEVLSMAIEQGVTMGAHRAYKHTSSPRLEDLQDCIHQAVMSSLYEWFEIDDHITPH